MMEKFRQRQIELPNKTAEAEQKKAGPAKPPGQPCVGLAFLCMTPATGFAEEKSYVCAINEVYECVTVTGCSRVSQDANVAGIMVLDVEKKQLRSAPLGGEPRADDIEGLIRDR